VSVSAPDAVSLPLGRFVVSGWKPSRREFVAFVTCGPCIASILNAENIGDTTMQSKGRAIVEMDVNELLELLNKAFADEWLAYYQYWVGEKVVTGPMRSSVSAELLEHAADELKHAGMLAERIVQLGGTPILKPEEWYKVTNCGYDPPQDPRVKTVLEQNVKAEQCAIGVYNKILQTVGDKDPLTYNMAREILEDEVEHEFDLQTLLEDLELTQAAFRKAA
jgi:bacterioferritin